MISPTDADNVIERFSGEQDPLVVPSEGLGVSASRSTGEGRRRRKAHHFVFSQQSIFPECNEAEAS
jgi:hypothetical protein